MARHSPPDLHMERGLLEAGFSLIAGLDEAGRGAWAGPVVAAAVILPVDEPDLLHSLNGIHDSKLLTARQRERACSCIQRKALGWGLGKADAGEIDRTGLLRATRIAMRRALQALEIEPRYLLLDHLVLPEVSTPQTALPHGDARSLSIAAASILAKVHRDRVMADLGRAYPGYGFGQHKGYGTPEHRHALQDLGPCAIHRYSYAPVAAALRVGT